MDKTEVEEVTAPRGRSRNGSNTGNTVSLGPRDSLSGSLNIEGDVHVEGTVEGEVRATGDIDIEASASVQARLDGRNITVRGQVKGDVVAQARLTVGGSGTLVGDIRASRLRVDDGGTVNGTVTMGSAAVDARPSSATASSTESSMESSTESAASVYSVPEEASPDPPSFGPLPA
ncbi:MAG: polymer-forming cytoskeletal protein [Chloroflexi bacterium]|nr:MAG: polymer-forming cytoskeletal protein [Chloroflexota bacterium]